MTRRELYNDIVEQLIDKSYDGLGQCNYDGGMASPSKAAEIYYSMCALIDQHNCA